jgi:hypothetical protein
MASTTGDYEKARRFAIQVAPGHFSAEPKIDVALVNDALLAAHIERQLGDQGQARRILAQVLEVTKPRPGVRQPNSFAVGRVHAYAMLGDKEKALAELRGAIDRGYRTYYDVDAFIRLDHYPDIVAGLGGDPRFQAMIREIETDNARMRARLTAGRLGSPATATR